MTASSRTPDRISIDPRSDWLVIASLVVALLLGGLFKISVQSQTLPIEDPVSGLKLSIPATWEADQDTPDVMLAAFDSRSASTFKTGLTIISRQLDTEGGGLDQDTIVDRLIERHGEELSEFHLLAIEDAMVAGSPAKQISYGYVAQPESVDRPFQAALPVVVQAAEYVIFTPDRYYVLSFLADSQEFDSQTDEFNVVLKSVDLP